MTSAEICRRNGWKPGDRLVGDEGFGPTVIEITAIGECGVLAKEISHEGQPSDAYEMGWSLDHRDWKRVEQVNA